ncbi:MAG TPA: histidine kinase, partial [Cytophagales bacterium]|nr:histidine kinase [Cytophagales bacterium]
IFAFVVYLAFNYSRRAEQNKVWVGLAKETAHQLGTPLSSLMAWLDYFRADEDFTHPEVIEELEKDVEKFRIITERFSNIGSEPVLKDESMHGIIQQTVQYLQRRVSSKVKFKVMVQPEELTGKVNRSLFEWVIENLCKNAVDAMGGDGFITIHVFRHEGRIAVDVSDTGKGIPKGKLRAVFRPGFTTKQRGWGLGLTLVKRIVEEYHEGKIFVKQSEVDKGTTFRLLLRP